MTIKDLKPGDCFTTKPIAEPHSSQVWIRDAYDRTERRYLAIKWSDVTFGKLFKADIPVFTDFVF